MIGTNLHQLFSWLYISLMKHSILDENFSKFSIFCAPEAKSINQPC